jgi:hypothetical protein
VSIDDRLSFGEGPLGGTSPETQPEQPEPTKKPNRAFIFLAIAMGGLILLGILALVGALGIWLPRQKATQIAQVTQTVAAMTMEAAAWTPTMMPSPTFAPATWTPTPLPTWTVQPTATATRVVKAEEPTAKPTATPTKAKSAEWGGGSQTPSAGLGELGGLGTAAIATGLAGLVFAVRKLRNSR